MVLFVFLYTKFESYENNYLLFLLSQQIENDGQTDSMGHFSPLKKGILINQLDTWEVY